MLRHLLKLIWKRKNRNLLLSAEILLAFLIVFAIAAFGVRYWQLYHMPIGFKHDNVWSVSLLVPQDEVLKMAELDGVDRRLLQALQAMPQVEKAAIATFPPFMSATMNSDFFLRDGSNKTKADMLEGSDDLWSTLGMQLSEGRWPSEQDEGSGAYATVLNQRMAAGLFPGKSALGQEFTVTQGSTKNPEIFKVVGVVDEFRNHGEFMSPRPFVLYRHSLMSSKTMPRTILLKVHPGTPRSFEADLQRQLKLVRNDWGYQVATLAELRSAQLSESLLPLKMLSVIAVFLLAMVAFGLFGVLWQNTTRRIPEIGLRRALGADTGSIYRQIVAEQALLSSAAMVVGLALLVQLPLTGAFGDALNWQVFGAALALSMAVIYLLSLLCSLYPGWRASRLHPAAALHYE
jgi:putative ABC transport system permease protein